MRDKLNDNPMAQVGLIALLAIVAAFMLMKPGGGESEEEEPAAGGTIATVNGVTATGATPGEAVEGAIENLSEGAGATAAPSGLPAEVPVPPLPAPVRGAYERGNTVALLVVNDGSVDRALVEGVLDDIGGVPNTSLFVVPVRRVPRYAALTVGVNLNRVPALVVMRPKRLSGGEPEASVDYGFQTPQSAVQAVRDATYKGPEATYNPD